MSTHTTSFKIAQYILMFLVAVLCVGIIIWVLTAGKKNNDGQPSVDNVIRVTNTNPRCGHFLHFFNYDNCGGIIVLVGY